MLLQMEQGSLNIGSVLLVAALGAVIVATRRIDWYALAEQMRRDGRQGEPGPGADETRGGDAQTQAG